MRERQCPENIFDFNKHFPNNILNDCGTSLTTCDSWRPYTAQNISIHQNFLGRLENETKKRKHPHEFDRPYGALENQYFVYNSSTSQRTTNTTI